jgi:hypothetical protein
MEVLNLGRGGAGPSFFSKDNDKLLKYINDAKFAIIQVMSGRSESNSLFNSKGLGFYTRISDGASIGCDNAFRELLEKKDKDYIARIVSETRYNWVINYKELLRKIKIPKILLWFSVRKPHYKEKYRDLDALFGEFPQLVNLEMLDEIKNLCNEYVECVSRRGLPQLLINRFNGKPISVEDKWSGIWNKNWYYPSPEMHIEAADALEDICKKYLGHAVAAARPQQPSIFTRWLPRITR